MAEDPMEIGRISAKQAERKGSAEWKSKAGAKTEYVLKK